MFFLWKPKAFWFEFEFMIKFFISLSQMSSLYLFLAACWPGRRCARDESSNAEESQLGFMSTLTPVQKHITMHPNAHGQTFAVPVLFRDSWWDAWISQQPFSCSDIQSNRLADTLQTQAHKCIKSQAQSHLCCISAAGNRDNIEPSAQARKKILPVVVSMETVPLLTLRGGQATSGWVTLTLEVAHERGGREFEVV